MPSRPGRALGPNALVLVIIAGVGLGLAGAVIQRMLAPAAVPPAPTTIQPGPSTNNDAAPSATPTDAPSPADAANPYARFSVPPFALTDAADGPVDESIFEGRHTVLQFFFTACPGPCPATTRIMADLQARAAGTRLRLVSISVDGGRDTPQAIANYAAGFGADPARWTFLTGPVDDVQALLREGLGFTIRRDPNDLITDAQGRRFANILHPTQIMLVGPDRRVLALAPYTDDAAVESLVRTALDRAGPGVP